MSHNWHFSGSGRGAGGYSPNQSVEITRVQFSSAKAATLSSLPIVLPDAPSDGNALIIAISFWQDSTLDSITQTGATWAKAVDSVQVTNSVHTEIWYAFGVSGADDTATLNWSGTVYSVGVMAEYTGIGALDQVDEDVSGVNSTPITCGPTDTTTANDELWIGSAGQLFQSYTTVDGDWNIVATDSETLVSGILLDQIVVAAGTADFSLNMTAAATWASAIATFKA